MHICPETRVDGYKLGHKDQYPDGTVKVLSNLTARASRRGVKKTIVAGTQYTLQRFFIDDWNLNFFNKPKEEVLLRFQRKIKHYLGEEEVSVTHLALLHDLGYLPLAVYALPEGSAVPLRVPSLVVYNTRPEFYWLVNYMETIISTTMWGICTSATTAKIYREILTKYAEATVGDASFVPFQGHDFSFRGMFGLEAACMSSYGHALSFLGSDTVPVIDFVEQYYGLGEWSIILSVNATEHAVMCAGKKEAERQTFERLAFKVYPKGILSIVSDTWNFWDVVKPEVGGILYTLKDRILNRPGKIVVRPDSGDPVKIITGEAKPIRNRLAEEVAQARKEGYKYVRSEDRYYEILTTGNGNGLRALQDNEVTPAIKGAIQCLWEIFGGTTSSKGYKLLDEHIGLIYGDSITVERAAKICELLATAGFASTNVVFGIGSYTYGFVTRDTDGYAIKATFVQVLDEERAIFKDPATDSGVKKSAKGITAVFLDEKGEYVLKEEATWHDLENCAFEKIFENGKILKTVTLEDVRKVVASQGSIL